MVLCVYDGCKNGVVPLAIRPKSVLIVGRSPSIERTNAMCSF
jgi:hypothetical protein